MTDIQNIRDVQMVGQTKMEMFFKNLREKFYKPDEMLAAMYARETVGEEGIEQMQTIDPETYQRVKELLKEAEDGGIRVSRSRPLQYGKEEEE
jgi:hypothetical protein